MATCLRKQLNEELRCSICLDRLVNPLVFPCQHSYCSQCIRDYCEKTEKDGVLSCPECKAEVEVSIPANLSHLKRNYRVNGILECMNESKANSVNIFCDVHSEEQYKYYCRTCETPACRDCTLQRHHRHDFCTISEIAGAVSERLLKKLVEVKEESAEVTELISHLKNLHKNVALNHEQIEAEINQHFDSVTKTIESHRKRLIDRAKKLTNDKSQEINKKIEESNLTLGRLKSGIDLLEAAFRAGKDVELVATEKEVSKNLGDVKSAEEHNEVTVCNNMKFLVTSSIEEIEKSFMDSHLVANDDVCLKYCTSTLEPKQVKVQEQAVVTVRCKDSSNHDIKHGGQVVRAEFTGSANIRQVGVIDHNDGSHDMKFKPKSSGSLTINVYINGHEATNCKLKTTVCRA